MVYETSLLTTIPKQGSMMIIQKGLKIDFFKSKQLSD